MNHIDRARKQSAEMSALLEGPPEATQPKSGSTAVDEMSAFLGQHHYGEVDRRRLSEGGFLMSRTQLEKKLAHYKHHLSNYMKRWPREKGETLADYRTRLQSSGDHSCYSVMEVVANIEAHFAQEAGKERVTAHQADEERKVVERRQRVELERRASPDPQHIRILLRKIEDAEEGEKLLHQIAVALDRHRSAEAARAELSNIYDHERSACTSLGRRSPSRPAVPQATREALDFATAVARANAPAPRYPGGAASAPSVRRG